MRTMTHHKTGVQLKILEHIILKNLWEYYVCEAPTNTSDIKLCLVMGFETEIGDVSLSEIKPYIALRTKDLKELMPAPGYDWAEGEK